MKKLLLVTLLLLLHTTCFSNAKPLHWVLSDDKYFVVYDNNKVIEYNTTDTMSYDLTKQADFGSFKLTRILCAVPNKHVVVGACDGVNMPLWVYKFNTRRWTELYAGNGAYSPFCYSVTGDSIINCAYNNPNVVKININTGVTFKLGSQPK